MNVHAVRIASYALGGLFAGIAALALTGLVHTTDAPQSTEYTLPAIAAVALGGTSLAGGRGGLAGALYGAFAIYLLQNLLATLQIDPAYLAIVYGGTLIVAVVLGGRLTVGGKTRSHRTPWRFGGAQAAVVDRAQESRILAVGEVSRAEKVGAAERRHVTIWTRLAEIQARYPIIQVLAVAAVFIYGVETLPALGQWSSIKVILLIAGLTGLASAGQTLLILMGGFDLGVAGFIVAGAVSVTALQGAYHIPFLVAMAAAVAGSAVLGAIAGNVCHRYRIQPLIVTLAMGTIAVGLVEIQNGGTATGSAQPWLAGITEPISKTFGVGLPPIIAIWIVVAIIFFVFLQRTVTGRRLFSTGANERAAEYALVHTRMVWTLTFAFSAGAAALVGVLICGYAGGVTTTLGDPYLFGSVVVGDRRRHDLRRARQLHAHVCRRAVRDGAHRGPDRPWRQRRDDADRPGRDHPARDHGLRPPAPAEGSPMTHAPAHGASCSRATDFPPRSSDTDQRTQTEGEVRMSKERKRVVARRARVMLAVGATAAVAATVALTGTGSAAAKTAKLAATHPCGYSAPVGPANPSGIYKNAHARAEDGLLRAIRARSSPSPWAHSKPVKGPWKIGYIAFAATNPYNLHVIAGLKSQFAAAKAKGLVTGSLEVKHPGHDRRVDAGAGDLGGPADGPSGHQRHHHGADRRCAAGARDRRRRQGRGPRDPDRHPAAAGEVRRRGVVAEPDRG